MWYVMDDDKVLCAFKSKVSADLYAQNLIRQGVPAFVVEDKGQGDSITFASVLQYVRLQASPWQAAF